MLLIDRFYASVPVKRAIRTGLVLFRRMRRASVHAGHFKKQLCGIRSGNAFVRFEKIDLVAFPATDKTLPEPGTVVLPDRKDMLHAAGVFGAPSRKDGASFFAARSRFPSIFAGSV